MRHAFSILALLCCAACTPAQQVPASQKGIIGAPFKGSGAQALARAGTPDAPTYEQILGLFGAADVARREGRGGLLSYRLAGCALALAFTEDASGALRLSVVEAGPPSPRDPRPSLEACTASASARKTAREAVS